MKLHLRDKLIIVILVTVLVPTAFYLVYITNAISAQLTRSGDESIEHLLDLAEYKYWDLGGAAASREDIEPALRAFIKGGEVFLLDDDAVRVETSLVLIPLGEARATIPSSQWAKLAATGEPLLIPVSLAFHEGNSYRFKSYRLAVKRYPAPDAGQRSRLLVVLVDEGEQQAFRRQVLRDTVLGSGVFVALALALALLFSQRFIQPILELQRWAEQAARGDRQRKIPVSRNDELGQLARSLSLMAGSINEHIANLTELKQYSDCIIGSMFSGVITLEPHGRIRAANQRAWEILDINEARAAELTHRDYRDALRRFPSLVTIMTTTLEQEKCFYREECEIVMASGDTKVLGLNSNQLLNDAGQVLGAAFFFQDLTNIKQLEERVQRKEKMAALGEMAGAIAHEVRNPLNPILGFAQLIQAEDDLDEIHENAKIIVSQVADLQRLVENLLLYTRGAKVEWADIDIPALIEEVLQLHFKEIYEKELQVKTELPAALVVVSGRVQLLSCVDNLVRNAIAVMKPGGTVSVKAYRDGATAVIEVSDTGPGIPANAVKRLFEPFFTTRAQGTGLGLTITNKMVRDLGGQITVASQEGRGTTFSVVIPVGGEDEKSTGR